MAKEFKVRGHALILPKAKEHWDTMPEDRKEMWTENYMVDLGSESIITGGTFFCR